MPGRDLSAELFGSAPQGGGRDLSADLFDTPKATGQAPSRLEKIGRGMMDPINGGAQLLTNMLPDSVVQAGNRVNNWLADKTGLVAKLPEGGVDQQVRQQEAEYQARRSAAGESGFDGYRMLGNVVSPANAAIPTGSGLAALGLGGKVAAGAAGGAMSGAMAPVVSGSGFADEKLKQIGLGAAAGGAVPLVTAGLSRVISPNASRSAELQLLRKEGVQPTIGQTLGGAANKVEERLQSVPIMGDMISSARNKANGQFQTAAFNRALKPVGEALPEGVAGRDAVVYTENLLKQRYDNVLDNIGAIAPDEAFGAKVADLTKMVNRLVMPKAEKQKFFSALNDVKASLDDGGVMTSDAFKSLESSLGSDARRLGSSQNIYEAKLAPAVKQLQEELRSMLGRQAGDSANDLKAVNAAWANFKRVQNAASKLGSEDGSFTPAQFQNAVRALDKSKDKAAFARGSALGQDLADAGKKLLTNKVPNSGTAERMWPNVLAVGSGMVSPAIPVGLAGGAALYTTPAQRALTALVSSRPALAQPIAERLDLISPLLVPGAAQIANQY